MKSSQHKGELRWKAAGFVALGIFLLFTMTLPAFAGVLSTNGGYENGTYGYGPGAGYAQDQSSVNLPVGCVVQYIFAGANDVPDAIDPVTHLTTGDDAIIATYAVGDDNVFVLVNGQAGLFYNNVIYTNANVTSAHHKVFMRTFNTNNISTTTYYGNSAAWDGAYDDTFTPYPNDYCSATFNTSNRIGVVSNAAIARGGDTAGSSVILTWASTGNVDIHTKTGVFSTDQSSWTKEFADVSGTSQIDASQVGNGVNKWYKIVPAGTALVSSDLLEEVLGKFDYQFTAGDTHFISLPVIPFDTGVNSVFGGQLSEGTPATADKIGVMVGGAWQQAFLNSTTHLWTGTLTTVGPDLGYYVIINSASPSKAVSVVGKIASSARAISLVTGQNMVGSSYPVSVVINSAGLNVSIGLTEGMPATADKIGTFTGGAWTQSFLSSTSHQWSGTVTSLDPGKGYFIIVNGSGTTWSYAKPY